MIDDFLFLFILRIIPILLIIVIVTSAVIIVIGTPIKFNNKRVSGTIIIDRATDTTHRSKNVTFSSFQK